MMLMAPNGTSATDIHLVAAEFVDWLNPLSLRERAAVRVLARSTHRSKGRMLHNGTGLNAKPGGGAAGQFQNTQHVAA